MNRPPDQPAVTPAATPVVAPGVTPADTPAVTSADTTTVTPADTPAVTPSVTPAVTPAAWGTLRRFTDARIALGRAGHSLPTAAHLAFQLAHAQARDAVHLPFDPQGVAAGLQALGLSVLHLQSAAGDRATYLQRPDLGRRLNDASRAALQQRQAGGAAPVDLAFVVGDGLSALAIHQNAVPLIAAVVERLRAATPGWLLGPVAIVEQARVAVGDEAGGGLRARCVVVLIGERPGLSSPDSMGLYLTWNPRPGLTDASRNCISNVRPAGLAMDAAADKLVQLLQAARHGQVSGVALKDDRDDAPAALPGGGGAPGVSGVGGRGADPLHNFLLGP